MKWQDLHQLEIALIQQEREREIGRTRFVRLLPREASRPKSPATDPVPVAAPIGRRTPATRAT